MQAIMLSKFPIRFMVPSDMPEVLAIERASYPGFSWTEHDFSVCLKKQHCIGKVAEIDEQVIGYMIYEHVRPTIKPMNITVSPGWRRCGVGRALVQNLKTTLCPQRYRRIVQFVDEYNICSQLFLRACGLRATAVFRDYYEDGEDAYAFEYWHSEPAESYVPHDLTNRITAFY